MTKIQESALHCLLATQLPADEIRSLLRAVQLAPSLLEQSAHEVSRAVISKALNLLLFRDLLTRVPSGRRYVEERVARGGKVVFDHGALRTVDWGGMGDLVAGEEAITRVLIPLGYRLGATHSLDRLGMTGRSYTHIDFPEDIPQFFVSELHPERFSAEFQQAVSRVTASSRDPLTPSARDTLGQLTARGLLSFDQAEALLPTLVACFRRQHATPHLSDYEILLAESAEMAWIATEGNAFNHATDRVRCLDELVEEQRRLNRPLKDTIETSRSGRVRQTAFRADPVERDFIGTHGELVQRTVPGSFYEFIQRARIPDSAAGTLRLDLAFDTSNAQGIFKMTAAVAV
jgi:Domain of unknown function (DUF1338)